MKIVDQVSGLFKAKSQVDLDTVRTRLAEAEAELPALAERVRSSALAAALDASAEGKHRKAVAAHRQQEDLVASLRLALAEADRIEAERRAAARLKQQKARLFAGRSHLERFNRGIRQYEEAVGKAAAAWRQAIDASEAFAALVGPGWSSRYGELARARLVRLGELELARVGYENNQPFAPGSAAAGRPLIDELKPISEMAPRPGRVLQ